MSDTYALHPALVYLPTTDGVLRIGCHSGIPRLGRAWLCTTDVAATGGRVWAGVAD
ncbi:MAG: hypothetical protein OEY55_13760 [Acidimicrobiia bacterium]|nr:hypothetical protein [Acidimicrobiia bacterium]